MNRYTEELGAAVLDSDGEFVRYDDTESLRSENGKLLDALTEARGTLKFYADNYSPGNAGIAMRAIDAALASTEPEVCRWHRREKNTAGANRWHSECGLGCASASEGIEAPDMNYCPKCGKPLEIVNEEKEA